MITICFSYYAFVMIFRFMLNLVETAGKKARVHFGTRALNLVIFPKSCHANCVCMLSNRIHTYIESR